jgi:DNA-directed RNA polymerase specialized sigma subunit
VLLKKEKIMALSKEEKEYFRPTLNVVKTKQNLKDLIYTLYVDHNYEYRSILSIIRQKIKTINIQTIIKILEDLDIKRCIQKDNCKSSNGYIQSRSNFYNTNISTDCKKSQCIDCISFQKTYNSSDENKKHHMDYFQSLKLEEKEDYIIKLYIKHNYTYSEIHKMTRVSQKEILKIIKTYGYKRCANGENCKSLFGPLQKFENFYELKNSLDGYDYTCSYCNKFRIHFEMADEHKKEHMLQFQNFQVLEEKEKFIINLYKEGYESRYLGSITLIGIDEITKILQKYDIKRCGSELPSDRFADHWAS